MLKKKQQLWKHLALLKQTSKGLGHPGAAEPCGAITTSPEKLERQGFHFPAVFLINDPGGEGVLIFFFFPKESKMLRFSLRCQDFFLLPFLLVFSAFGQVFNSHVVFPLKPDPSREGARGAITDVRHFASLPDHFHIKTHQSSACFTEDIVLQKKKKIAS